MKRILALLFCATLLSLPAAAEEWRLDADHSKLRFAVDARFIGADGQFRKFQVKADINEQELEKSHIEMTVDVASLDTNSEKRDNHLRSKDFFDVANYPTAQIVTKGIRKLSPTNYEADAEITIRGVTKPIHLPARILLNEEGILRFRGTVEINRYDFGVSYQSRINRIEDIATVTYEFNLRKPKPAPAATAPKTP